MQRILRLEPWVVPLHEAVSSTSYYHTVLAEDRPLRTDNLQKLKKYVDEAHDEARRHIDNLMGDALDPFDDLQPFIYPDYPWILDQLTLQGYFGEVLAAIFAENYNPFDIKNWYVPAYMFISHDIAFDKLETYRQTGKLPGIVPGQSGDDCLAFVLNEDGNVIKCLVCESKCSITHDSHLIVDAHKNLSRSEIKPVSVRKVIEILRGRDDPESRRWLESLQRFWIGEAHPNYERYDLFMYACGKRPSLRSSWLPSKESHDEYKASRKLHAVEIHFDQLDELIKEIYGPA